MYLNWVFIFNRFSKCITVFRKKDANFYLRKLSRKIPSVNESVNTNNKILKNLIRVLTVNYGRIKNFKAKNIFRFHFFLTPLLCVFSILLYVKFQKRHVNQIWWNVITWYIKNVISQLLRRLKSPNLVGIHMRVNNTISHLEFMFYTKLQLRWNLCPT